MPKLFSHISCILICSHLYKDFNPSLKFITKYRGAGRVKIPNLPGLDDGAISDETIVWKDDDWLDEPNEYLHACIL